MKLKYPQKIHKTGKNFRGGGEEFSGWPEYIPLDISGQSGGVSEWDTA